jgi:hypothetical protein
LSAENHEIARSSSDEMQPKRQAHSSLDKTMTGYEPNDLLA